MKLARTFIAKYRIAAMFLLAAALCVKVAVPAGYMLGGSSKIFSIQICHDGLSNQTTRQIVIPMDGKSHDSGKRHGSDDSPCPYSALTLATLSGTDATLLIEALNFILARGFIVQSPVRTAQISYLRPPLRGPPAAF